MVISIRCKHMVGSRWEDDTILLHRSRCSPTIEHGSGVVSRHTEGIFSVDLSSIQNRR